MAKSISPDDRAKVKFRVIEFELEGGNTTVESSVRNLTNAIQKNGTISIAKPATLKGQAELLQSPSTANSMPAEEVPAGECIEEGEATGTDSSPAKPRSPRKPKTLHPVEMELTGGDMPFKDYCEGKNLDSDRKKYLACAMWAKEHGGLSTITDGHIYTMFKFMKWPVPADVGAPLRSLKGQGYVSNPERGKYAINHLGENEVNQMGLSA